MKIVLWLLEFALKVVGVYPYLFVWWAELYWANNPVTLLKFLCVIAAQILVYQIYYSILNFIFYGKDIR